MVDLSHPERPEGEAQIGSRDTWEWLDQGRVQVAREHLGWLRANGLTDFESMMRLAHGDLMRSVPGRSTVRIHLRRPDGSAKTAFLKRYEPSYLTPAKRGLRWLGWPEAQDEAWHEGQMLRRLRAGGFRVPEVIALGQQRCCRWGIVTRSFLLTAEIAGGVAAHEYMRGLEAKARRSFLREVAGLAWRFHAAGFIHKDFYLNHIFVVLRPGAPPELHLIDLQRAQGPARVHPRWWIKDLAALVYTAQLAGASRAELGRFLLACLGESRFSTSSKRLARRTCRRVAWLHRRRPKHDAIWDQPGVRPRNV